jgi:hypothetical protein
MVWQPLYVCHSLACTQVFVDVGGGLSYVDTVFVPIIRESVHGFGVSQQEHGQFRRGLRATRSTMPKQMLKAALKSFEASSTVMCILLLHACAWSTVMWQRRICAGGVVPCL